jgi:hypothetical protein
MHQKREPRITRWGKHKSYECPFCSYATLSEDRIWEHLDTHRKVTIQPVDAPQLIEKKAATSAVKAEEQTSATPDAPQK